MKEETNKTASAKASPNKPSTQIKVGNHVLLSKDVDQAIDEILLEILKESPYYGPLQEAVHKPLVELMKKAVPRVAAKGPKTGERPDKNGATESPQP